jgi:murein DD-endopeptidase MepM/ murein hydrolase activator NlpD
VGPTPYPPPSPPPSSGAPTTGPTTPVPPTVPPTAPSAQRFIRPVDGPVTDGFGFHAGRNHEGVDFEAPVGTPVRAAGGGTVVHAGPGANYGNLVIIDHGDGLTTRYAHLSAVQVSVGQQVPRGQVIGAVGMTGEVTGPQLHFEVRRDDEAVDPAGFLSS